MLSGYRCLFICEDKVSKLERYNHKAYHDERP